MKKTYISANQLMRDSYELAMLTIRTGYRPDLIVGIWRGGTPVGIAVHEAFEFTGRPCGHLAIRTASYTGIDKRQEVIVEGMDYLAAKIVRGTRLLLVDDVFDSGQTMAKIIEELNLLCADRHPEIRVAVPYFKPLKNTTSLTPDYFLYETDDWLVFPHELTGLTNTEVLAKPGIGKLASQLIALRDSEVSTED